MLKIVRVGTVGGDMMDVHLDNGNIIMVGLENMYRMPCLAALQEDGRIYYPHTDGCDVYWKDGPRLSLAKIMQILETTDVP